MDQGKIEAVIRDIIAQEVGSNASPKETVGTHVSQTNDDISPLLRDLRDSVQEKIKRQSSEPDGEQSSLLDGIARDVRNRIS